MSGLRVLEGARELLREPGVWIRGYLVRGAPDRQDTRRLEYYSPEACRFCLLGAIYRVANGRIGPDVTAAQVALVRTKPLRKRSASYVDGEYLGAIFQAKMEASITAWNDDDARGVEDVLAVLDEAIAAEEKA